MKKNNNRTNGFTLLEILVVVTIIGLMTAISVVSYGSLLIGSRDSRRKSDLEQIRAALELYRSNVGTYPVSTSWDGACSNPVLNNGSDYIPLLTSGGYITSLPHDPRENKKFPPCDNAANSCYLYRSDGVQFKLLAFCGLEGSTNVNDQYHDPFRPTTSFQISSNNYTLNNW